MSKSTLAIQQANLHHDLPRVNRQVGIIETPIKLLFGDGLVCGIVVGCQVLMGEGVGGCYALLGVEDEHTFQKIDSCSC